MLAQPRTLIPFGFERRRNWKYLLDVEFASNASAPLTSYDGEVGSFDILNDATPVWSVSGGAITPSGQATGGVPSLSSKQAWSQHAGRCFAARAKFYSAIGGSGLTIFGFGPTSATPSSTTTFGTRASVNTDNWQALTDAGALNIGAGGAAALDTDYKLSVVFRETMGYFLFLDNALIWVGTKALVSGESYRAFVGSTSALNLPEVDYVRVFDLGAPFDSDYGIALLHTASVSGSDYTASANVIADLVVTAPASLAGTAGLRLRKNGNDYWQVNFDNLGRLRLQRYAGGVAQGSAVNLANSVISGSAALTLRVIASGSSMDFFTLSGSTWTKRGTTQTDGVLNANTGVMPFADSTWLSGGGSMGQLDAYARSDGSYSVVDGT